MIEKQRKEDGDCYAISGLCLSGVFLLTMKPVNQFKPQVKPQIFPPPELSGTKLTTKKRWIIDFLGYRA